MKKLLWAAGILGLLGGAGLYAHEESSGKDMGGMDMGAETSTPEKTVTLVGEVLDMDCYMNEGAHGKDHQSCAVMCLQNGAPVGLLTDDGKAYFLTANESKGKMKFYEKVRDLGGQKVRITGVVQKRAGTASVRIDSAEKI
jgi:hypothetical protein